MDANTGITAGQLGLDVAKLVGGLVQQNNNEKQKLIAQAQQQAANNQTPPPTDALNAMYNK